MSENTFGLIKREFDPDYRIEDHIPAEKGAELRTNSAPMQRFVFSQGLGVITEGLPEYVASGNSLAVTILRSTGKLSAAALNTRNFPAGPPLDTLGAQCVGKHTVKYAICPSENPAELFKEADEFMGSLIADTGRACRTLQFPGIFLKIDNKNILFYGAKIPENREVDGVVARLFNVSDEPQSLFLKQGCFKEVNSLEKPISGESGKDKEIVFNPHELKSLLFLKK